MANPSRHCGNRLFEWTMAGILLAIGLQLLLWPHSFASSRFRPILNVTDPGVLTAFYLMVGAFRVLALFANGKLEVWGPRVRAFAATCGALVWLQMSAALFVFMRDTGTDPSPGIPIYIGLAIAELISTYRAMADAKYRSR